MSSALRILLSLLAVNAICSAQTYPRWFLEPVNLKCGSTASGYVRNFFHQSSSDSAAYVKACENLAWQHQTEISGGEAYWETEAGVFWMGSDVAEQTDSTYLHDIMSSAKKVDEFSSREMVIVLVSAGDCSVQDSMVSVMRCARKQPRWVESVPQGGGYTYAEGVAPEYFYESSSWELAEKKARFNLARNIKVSLKTIQKVEGRSGQEIRNEDVSVTLKDVEVVYRWRDVGRRLFFVLIRMPAR